MMIHPRTMAQRIGLASGGLSVDDQAFTNLFGIAGVSPDHVKKWLTPERSQSLARHPNLRLYVEGSDALIVLPEKTLHSKRLEQQLAQALDIAQIIYGKLD
jgi:CTP-dependent riboflavin kinase